MSENIRDGLTIAWLAVLVLMAAHLMAMLILALCGVDLVAWGRLGSFMSLVFFCLYFARKVR